MKILAVFSWDKQPKTCKAGAFLVAVGAINLLMSLGYTIGAMPEPPIGWRVLLPRFFIALIAMILLHEGLHAIALKTYGYRVSFGVGFRWWAGPVFMTELNTDDTFTVSRLRFVLLAPQALTIALFLLSAIYPLSIATCHVIWMMASFNLVGGMLDIYEVAWLRRFNGDDIIQITPNGLAVASLEGGLQ